MATFLQIVGAVFVALFLVVIAAFLFLKWKLSSWAKQMSDQVQEFGGMMEKMAAGGGPMAAAMGGMMEPLSLKLHATEDEPDEDFALQIEAWTKSLSREGFETVGDFEADPTMLWMRAFVHPESGAAAVLYVMPLAGAWYDVTLRIDGQSVTMTDSQREMADSPPWSKIVQLDAGTPPAKAYERLLRSVGEPSVEPYTRENFPERFQNEYQKAAIWRAKRGESEDEIKRISSAEAGEQVDNSFVQQMLDSRGQMRAYQINEFLKEQWLKDSEVSAYDYEQIEDRIVVIHELTPPDLLLDTWGECYGEHFEDEPEDLPDVSELVAGRDPRQAFRDLQQKLPPGGRFQHYAAVEGDISGDLWLRPDDY